MRHEDDPRTTCLPTPPVNEVQTMDMPHPDKKHIACESISVPIFKYAGFGSDFRLGRSEKEYLAPFIA